MKYISSPQGPYNVVKERRYWMHEMLINKTRPSRVNSQLMERTIGKWGLWELRGGADNDDSNKEICQHFIEHLLQSRHSATCLCALAFYR